MTEAEFLTRWRSERQIYESWGSFVTDTILKDLSAHIAPRKVNYFLKVPSEPRLKEDKSLLDKAFYRKKPYINPYDEITDKVGVRFVVLLESDIEIVKSIIKKNSVWETTLARDFLDERKKSPEAFGYQSVHYELRPVDMILHGEAAIPPTVPCEVQIRTLLQHAYSELTHDTTYKPNTAASPLVKRYCARSMALIEAADDLFLRVADEIKKAGEPVDKAMELLLKVYQERVPRSPDPGPVNALIIDAFKELLADKWEVRFNRFLDENEYLLDKLGKHAEEKHLFRQPAALLVYFFAYTCQSQTSDLWPLPLRELRPFYADQSIRPPQ
ncbi:GTP pyrophosphokinase [Desulfocurvibacter africanus]|uniref:GTP pyrophosphokinase n=1 Tax=Desulfocurvibacter africanus TaxID=873 RepID=UPI000684E177|nr:hypothetical protein [Desulfocurvibacter africanus]